MELAEAVALGSLAAGHARRDGDAEENKQCEGGRSRRRRRFRRQEQRGDRQLAAWKDRAEGSCQAIRDAESGNGGPGPGQVGELRRSRHREHGRKEEASYDERCVHGLERTAAWRSLWLDLSHADVIHACSPVVALVATAGPQDANAVGAVGLFAVVA